MRVVDFDLLDAGQNLIHGLAVDFPFVESPEIVGHQEAAAQQVIVQVLHFGHGEIHVAGLRRINPGIVVDVFVERVVARFADVNAGEAFDALSKVLVGFGIILHPPATATAATTAASTAPAPASTTTSAATSAKAAAALVYIFHAQEVELGVSGRFDIRRDVHLAEGRPGSENEETDSGQPDSRCAPPA